MPSSIAGPYHRKSEKYTANSGVQILVSCYDAPNNKEIAMGSQTFFTSAKGKTPKDAFAEARRRAEYDSGHGGYTGTIAEKHEFVMIEVPTGRDFREFTSELIEKGDRRVDDKWGPAGCVKISDDEYLFFGWASC
jgi:hypothetical protein